MKNTLTLILIFIALVNCYSQSDDNIEIKIELENLKKNTIKLENEIEEFEDRLEIVQTVKFSLSNATVDSVRIKNEIEKIKNFNAQTNESIIIRTVELLDELIYSSNSNFSRTVFQYSQSQENNTPEITFLSNLNKPNILDMNVYGELIVYGKGGYKELSYENFEKYKEQLSYNNLIEEIKKEHDQILSIVDGQINVINSEIENNDNKIRENQRKRLELGVKVGTKSSYDKVIFQLGFPVFTLFILLLYLIPLWFLYKKQNESPTNAESIYRMIYGSGLLTEVITVFLLTSTIILLGITDKLEPEILGTLIGGISGYVLGKSFRNIREGSNE